MKNGMHKELHIIFAHWEWKTLWLLLIRLHLSHSLSLCAFFLARCAYVCLCFYKMMHVSSLVNNFLWCLAWENSFRSFLFVEFCLFVCLFVGICSLGLCVECRSFTFIFWSFAWMECLMRSATGWLEDNT